MSDFKNKLQEIIRVDHAGEFGAKVIYRGQIAALKLKKDKETLKIIEHMKEQEDVHFDYFNEEIKRKKIRPTLMQPVWRVSGFALGFLTAMIDKKAAMVCTIAVEETIDKHYQEQLESLKINKDSLPENEKKEIEQLAEKIEKFRQEELEHRDIGYEHDAAEFKAFKPLSSFVKQATKFAIAVSKKL